MDDAAEGDEADQVPLDRVESTVVYTVEAGADGSGDRSRKGPYVTIPRTFGSSGSVATRAPVL